MKQQQRAVQNGNKFLKGEASEKERNNGMKKGRRKERMEGI
jgi:hypothetical protein